MQLTNTAASLMQMVREESNTYTFAEAGVLSMTVPAPPIRPYAPIPPYAPDAPSAASASPNPPNPPNPPPVKSRAERRCADSVLAYEASLRARMLERGIQGYELSLQHVLEGLLQQSQHFDLSEPSHPNSSHSPHSSQHSPTSPSNKSHASMLDTKSPEQVEAAGRLNMNKESTANLAASNPAVLPSLPYLFHKAVRSETCVWFNSFSGRVYRDISDSTYFYNWFCAKMTHQLNKGQRPDYVDEFIVENVKFGTLPPLLLNVQWSPNTDKAPFKDKDRGASEKDRGASEKDKGTSDKDKGRAAGAAGASGAAGATGAAGGAATEKHSPGAAGADDAGEAGATPYSDYSSSGQSGSDGEAGRRDRREEEGAPSGSATPLERSHSSDAGSGRFLQREEQSQAEQKEQKEHKERGGKGAEGREGSRRRRKRDKVDADEDQEYYAACTADMAYRSGCSVTISTK
jgi:hypothetical protein